MKEPQRIAIIGAGIVGLAHAWAAARQGHRVTVFERNDRSRGASVRNFGMVWPVGQPAGLQPLARRSRELWGEFLAGSAVYSRPSGSVHAVAHDDEVAVLEEFVERAPDLGVEVRMLSAREREATPGLRRDAVKAGMFSAGECNVDPREVMATLPRFLAERHGVEFAWNHPVMEVEEGRLRGANGRTAEFDRAFVCGGHELHILFPEVLAASPLKVCKLQMLRTVPQPGGWALGPMLASGLTLRHYANFQVCPSLAAVERRVRAAMPEIDRFGIHVMASQDRFGGLVLGDSHEYGDDIEIFDKAEVDSIMLRELRALFDFPDWTIAERWHGFYAKNPEGPEFRREVRPGVQVVSGTGGAGMTLSFGLADRALGEG